MEEINIFLIIILILWNFYEILNIYKKIPIYIIILLKNILSMDLEFFGIIVEFLIYI